MGGCMGWCRIPTHSAAGEELSKKQRQGVEKEFSSSFSGMDEVGVLFMLNELIDWPDGVKMVVSLASSPCVE